MPAVSPLLFLVLLLASVVVLVYHGAALYLARAMPRLEPEPLEVPPPAGSVSVIIAARDEELDLPATLDALLAQDLPPLEILVVEGGSQDASRAVIEARAPRVRRIDEPPLPEGWVGKNWACWTGAQAARGDWLWFLDADVRAAPAALRSTLAWAEREKAAIATLAPRVEFVSFWERVVLPFYVQMVLTYFRAPRTNLPASQSALVNGQYWLVRREVYDALGGHQAVRGRVLEDIAIARRARRAGQRLRIAWAPELASTRMYRDRHEMFEGLLKNVHGLDFSAARQAGFLVGLVGLFWLPLAVLPLGLVLGSWPIAALGGVLAFALFGKHVAFARAIGGSTAAGLAYPIAVGFYVVVVASSLVRGLRRGAVTWKGRAYPLHAPRTP